MNYVVDSSVAVKWFVREALHEQALELLDPEIRLTAPDLVICELTNILWKKCIRKEITALQGETIAQGITSYFVRLYPAAELHERALEIGLALGHPVYDCFFLACAEKSGSLLITDDRRLIDAVKGSDFEEITVSLGNPDRRPAAPS